MTSPKDTRASARRRGYDKAHEKWRTRVLQAHPNCTMCGAKGTPSDHADHKIPIRQGGARFDPANGTRLCRTCHSGPKQYQDNTGKVRGCDESGHPLDPSHAWNRTA